MLSKEMVELLSQYGYTAILLMVLMLWLGKYLEKNIQLEQDDRKKERAYFSREIREQRALFGNTIDKFDDKLDKFAEALNTNNSRLERVETDITKIKDKLETRD
ncbi:hypothetical protein [Clostridioides difficile]|uniref:hypothetical protein n=1 Tax=Clostridioides difficile TaxID=1496 RepID=UPI001C1A6886|nr:hypothetical protein [Clostridioides difficile]MDF3817552.1 hypothetical protein [Clostridioides difficile]HBF4283363.1 hypothetical protein [Clostridioides difficile]HBF5048887.1 hypothetical protein [Clostridioides difficile]HBF5114781.1 hypothetical protein [Clostridioides difficile]HBF5876722.1 hypothetical protein [Clostridioides difficile]